MFSKVLVANRGEIACRIIRTLHKMGVEAVAVFSEIDAGAMHVKQADQSICIGPAPAAQSYLCAGRILQAAQESGAGAIHPGYGFLSESHEFAGACESHGIAFIGPSPKLIFALGDKLQAREIMARMGVPVIPGSQCTDSAHACECAGRLGYPVIVKPSRAGGGRGMRTVASSEELSKIWDRAANEAHRSFGTGALFVEKKITPARHIEVQVFGDTFGNAIHLFERNCSMQRRHQKVIEETPSPGVSEALIAQMTATSVSACKRVGYFSAGTFEYLVDANEHFYFLEMNTRLQVEHPVTELVTGIDLVEQMIRVAAGERLAIGQTDVVRHGASIECRVYAEDPSRKFLPSPGTISGYSAPCGDGVRHDSGVQAGSLVPSHYDPLLAKLSVWAPGRQAATVKMLHALSEYVITGVRTNLQLLRTLVDRPEWESGAYDTEFIEKNAKELAG